MPKFNKLTHIKHPTFRGQRSNQEFIKVVEDLKERKGTFFRMGFRSYEKRENRKVLVDVLGVHNLL
jgi:hypothetical protein